jgi:hypothetical protein
MSPYFYFSGRAMGLSPSWGHDGQVASGVAPQPLKGQVALALLFKIREPDHWFMAPARLDKDRVPMGANAPWVCRNIPARHLDGAKLGA